MKARRTTFLALLVLISAVMICFSPTAQAQDTVQVKAGWNIIGSVKAGAIPDVLSTDPPGLITTEFYGYNPGVGYEAAATLTKGLGYWVKVSSDGIVVFNTTTSISDLCGAKRVLYGGKTYHTVQIGSQCWLDENLNMGTMVAGATAQTNNGAIEKYCYNNDPANCATYGGLYQWDEAMRYTTTPGTRGICPSGWHIPTRAEIQTLSSAVGGDGNTLKREDQGTGGGVGTNTTQFSALLAGYRNYNDGGFYNLGSYANYWSSTENDATNAYFLSLNYSDSSISLNYFNKSLGFSVRCLED